MLICPVCSGPLVRNQGVYRCDRGHSFDVAREGYVNLLRASKNGDLIGDDKFSARSRRDFLNCGYYAALKDGLCELLAEKKGNLLDICCGEGYYTSALGQNPNLHVYGFDISREMVRLAAKRGNATYFVANMASIPLEEASMDYCVHLFAPFNETAFCRILKPGVKLYTVVPGKYHLCGLKEALYETPYVNDEKLPVVGKLRLVATHKITDRICLACQEDIQAVFRMTPYYFHTSERDKEKLLAFKTLETPVEFVIGEFELCEEEKT